MNKTGQLGTVVVLGGGYAGLRSALDLDRSLPDGWDIAVVDASPSHMLHALLYEVATLVHHKSSASFYTNEYSHAALPFSDIFLGTRIRHIQAKVERIDPKTQTVRVLPTSFVEPDIRSISYDYLVVALGSETNYFNIPGLDRVYGLRTAQEALNIRSAILETFEQKKKETHIVVAGGGFTGVECAAELVGFVRHYAVRYGYDPSSIHIAIVEGCDRVLPHASTWASKKAKERLSSLGVLLLTEQMVESYDGSQIHLKGGKILPADVLIWTAGIKTSQVVSETKPFLLEKGCVVVDSYLRIGGYGNIFTAGDAMHCVYPDEMHTPVPATAQRAVSSGRLVAENITALITGQPLVPYVPSKPIWFIPLGGKYAIVDTGRFRMAGVTAWVLKLFFQLWYLMTIISFTDALQLWLMSVRTYVKND